MAKRNLANLAPSVLREGFPASSPSASSSSGSLGPPQSKPPSKLAALAMRSQNSRSSSKRPADQVPLGPDPSTRDLGPASSSPAASTTDVSSAPSARPSKLAALAASRTNANAPRPSPVARASDQKGSSIVSAKASLPAQETIALAGKPLSKLQQKLLASKMAKTNALFSGDGDVDMATADTPKADQPETCAGSDFAVSVLFPHMDTSNSQGRGSQSLFAETSHIASGLGAGPQVGDAHVPIRPVPGGSPFDLYMAAGQETLPAGQTELDRIEAVRKAFSGPSPDDVVNKAREGTNLAAKPMTASSRKQATR